MAGHSFERLCLCAHRTGTRILFPRTAHRLPRTSYTTSSPASLSGPFASPRTCW